MRISPAYANRTDLSTGWKWRFTIEEKIEQSRIARAAYRILYVGPLEVPFGILTILSGFWLYTVASGIESAFDFFDPYGDYDGPAPLIVFVVILLGVAFFVPYGWIPLAMTLWFIVAILFAGVMDDYDRELRRARGR